MNRLNSKVPIGYDDFEIELERLRDYKNRIDDPLPETFWQCLREIKSRSCADGDQETAKVVWCLETIGRIQDHFVSAFLSMRVGEFKEAWDELVHCENKISLLDGHFSEENGEFGIEHVRIHASQFQEFYPYTMGFSPGLVIEEMHCSICRSKISLRGKCGHTNGEIYDGELCTRVVTKGKLLHVSIVDRPAQKYSVIFPYGNDDPRLDVVKLIGESLMSPWHSWSFTKEDRREYHPAFRDVEPDHDCPCGSNQRYESCCSNEETVFPHFQIRLEYSDNIANQRLR